jgi:hypothetical protein
VCGSEFTSKDATLQGDSAEITPTPNAKWWDLVVVLNPYAEFTSKDAKLQGDSAEITPTLNAKLPLR